MGFIRRLQNYEQFDIQEIILSQEVCPDYVVKMKDGRVLKVEAELFAKSFKYHGHDPAKADLIIACYAKENEVEGVPVLTANKLWIYEPSPIEKLPPDSSLSVDELTLLGIIDFHGSIELSSLAQRDFKGDKEIYMRVPPDIIAELPRGKIETTLFTIVSETARNYIRKYHHVLIVAGFSDRACEAFDLLSRKELIKIRPVELGAAMYDGTIVNHEGWVPTEVYLTDNVKKYHREEVTKTVMSFLDNATTKENDG